MADNFLHEVDEYMREERMKKLWKDYKVHVFAAVAGLLVVVAGISFYKADKLAKAQANAASYMELIRSESKAEELSNYAMNAKGGYQTLGQLYAASLALKEGNAEEASALYKEVAVSDAPKPYVELAQFMTASSLVSVNVEQATAELQKLIQVKDFSYAGSALNLLAVLSINEKDTVQAKAYYMQLVALERAPLALKQRAEQALKELK